MPWCRLYEAADGWIVVCAVTREQQAALCAALDIAEVSEKTIADAIATLDVEDVRVRFAAHAVPAAISLHPCAVPGDEHVRLRELLTTVRHGAIGRVVQVGVPLHLSTDAPAVKGPAPTLT